MQPEEVEFIPTGCTSLVQPLDLAINKPFKDHFKDFYEACLSDFGITEKNKTTRGTLSTSSF